MLKQLRLENFKGLKTAKLDFGRITVLIGPNGTGKSSVSHALLALRQSIGNEELTVSGPLINLGTFGDVLNKEASNRQIGMGVSIKVCQSFPDLDFMQGGSFSYDAYFDPGADTVDAIIFNADVKFLEGKIRTRRPADIEPKRLTKKLPSGEIGVDLISTRRVLKPIMTSGSSEPPGLEQQARIFSSQMENLLSTLVTLLAHTYYVPSIRGLDHE